MVKLQTIEVKQKETLQEREKDMSLILLHTLTQASWKIRNPKHRIRNKYEYLKKTKCSKQNIYSILTASNFEYLVFVFYLDFDIRVFLPKLVKILLLRDYDH